MYEELVAKPTPHNYEILETFYHKLGSLQLEYRGRVSTEDIAAQFRRYVLEHLRQFILTGPSFDDRNSLKEMLVADEDIKIYLGPTEAIFSRLLGDALISEEASNLS